MLTRRTLISVDRLVHGSRKGDLGEREARRGRGSGDVSGKGCCVEGRDGEGDKGAMLAGTNLNRGKRGKRSPVLNVVRNRSKNKKKLYI